MSSLISGLIGIFSLLYVPYWILVLSGPFTVFTLHPLGMCLLFAGNALAINEFAFQRAQRASKQQSTNGKSTKSVRAAEQHQRLQLTAFLMLLLGFTTVQYAKFTQGYSHFVSWHGTLGIAVTAGLVSIQTGAYLIYSGNKGMRAVLAKAGLTTTAFWKVHRLVGWILFSIVTWVLVLGMFTGFMLSSVEQLRRRLLSFDHSPVTVDFGDLFQWTGIGLVASIWLLVSRGVWIKA